MSGTTWVLDTNCFKLFLTPSSAESNDSKVSTRVRKAAISWV